MSNLTEFTDGATQAPEFEGSWEKPGRSPTSAAIMGFIVVGIIYAYAQGIIAVIAMGLQNHGGAAQAGSAKTLVDILTARALAAKNPLRDSVLIAEFLFMLVPTILIIRRWHTKHVIRYIRFTKVPLAEIVLAILAAILFFPVSAGISGFLLGQLHFPDFLARIDSLLFASNTPSELVWVIIVVCVTPAICEETLFRGYVQRTLERTTGVKSLFIAGILFGLYHMRPLNLISLSMFGMMVGFFAYRSKSLLPGMAAHFTNNLITVLSLYKITGDKFASPSTFINTPVIVTLVAAAATIAVLFLYRKETRRNFVEPPSLQPRGEDPDS